MLLGSVGVECNHERVTFWDDAVFDNHPVWAQVDALAGYMDDERFPTDLDATQRASVVRLKTVLELLREHQQKGVKIFYTRSMFDNVDSTLGNQVNSNLGSFVSDAATYANAVNDAAVHVEGVFTFVAQWPALPAGGQAQAAGRAFSEYKREAEAALEELEDRNKDLTAQIEQIKTQMTTVETQMQTVETRYETSLTARDEEYSAAVGRVEESGKEAYDKAIQADIESRIEKLDALEKHGQGIVSATDAHRAEAEKLATAAEGSAEWLAKRAFARDFGMQARRKSAAAWLYDILGIGVIAAPLYFLLLHFLDNQDTDGTVAVSMTRLSIIFGAVILGGYLFSRGATNHRQARASKSAEIRLNTFEAFIAALAKEEQAEIRNGMAQTIYLRGRLADDEPDSPNPFGRIIDALAERGRDEKNAAKEA